MDPHTPTPGPISRPGLAPLEVIALAAIAFGVVLRVVTLGRENYWYDEVWSAYACGLSWGDMRALLRADLHPFGYHGVAKAFCLAVGDAGGLVLRTFSLLWGLVGIGLVGWAAWNLGRDRERALVAAGLLALSPQHVFYSQEARMYALGSVVVLLAGWAAARAALDARGGRIRWGVMAWLPVLAVAAVQVHYVGALAVAAVAVAALFAGPWRGAESRRWWVANVVIWGGAGALMIPIGLDIRARSATIATVSLWMPEPGAMDLLRSLGRSWAVAVDLVIEQGWREYVTGEAPLAWAPLMDWVPLAFAAWLGVEIARGHRHDRRLGAAFALSAVGFSVVLWILYHLGVRAFYWPRYGVLLLPLLCIAFSGAVAGAWAAGRWRRASAVVLLGWLAAQSAAGGVAVVKQPRLAPAAAAVEQAAPPGVPVYVVGVDFWPLYAENLPARFIPAAELRAGLPARSDAAWVLFVDTFGDPPAGPGAALLAIESSGRAVAGGEVWRLVRFDPADLPPLAGGD